MPFSIRCHTSRPRRNMTRNIVALIGLALLAGCSGGGGGDPATSTSAPTPSAQPDMLVATSDGLWRGKATGKGGLIFAQPNLQQQEILVSEGNVLYSRGGDVWTVHTDGTGDHALLNTADGERLRAVSGPWLIYEKSISGPNQSFVEEQWSLRQDTLAQFFLEDTTGFGVSIQFQGADRVILGREHDIFSISTTGAERINYAVLSQQELSQDTELSGPLTVADALIYRRFTPRSPFSSTSSSNLFAIPSVGGTTVPLDTGQTYVYTGGAIGARVVYQRCPFQDPGFVGACDVVSVQNDGTNQAVLASDQANEAVQGVTTDQVIIRRNLSGNDQLIAIPVTGGTEQLLMTMTDSEFVQLIVDDLLIVRRPSGTWTLGMNGTLTKIGSVAGDFGVMAVGDSICLNKGTTVWCMPQDGQGPQVKIADRGKVVGVL